MRFEMHVVVSPVSALRSALECSETIQEPAMPPSAARVAVGRGEFHSFGDRYTVTPAKMKEHKMEEALRYEVLVEVGVPRAFLRAAASFDWAASDMHLALYREPSSKRARREVARSNESLSTDKDSPFETVSALTAELEEGTYMLILRDVLFSEIAALPRGEAEGKGLCLRFGLGLDIAQVGAAPLGEGVGGGAVVGPKLLSVDPPGARKLPIGEPIVLVLAFSESLGTTKDGRSLEGKIECAAEGVQREFLCERALFLFHQDDADRTVLPQSIEGLKEGLLRVTFTSSGMEAGQAYFLHVQEGFFRNQAGAEVDASAHVRAHAYTVAACSCSNRGKCDAEGACVCDAGYSGTSCEGCASGYGEQITEDAGVVCVLKIKLEPSAAVAAAPPAAGCKQYSCSGHGACLLPSYSRKAPICLCHTGYADGDAGMCGACAEGYRGYPDCRRETEAQERDEDVSCTLPLLPVTLEDLGGGAAHVQGSFFLDSTRRRHVIAVRIKVESLVRVQVDTGISGLRARAALEKRTGMTGDWEVVEQGGTQGSLAHLVQGKPDGLSEFRIVLAYEFVDGGGAVGDCVSLSLQAGVYPQDLVKHVAGLPGQSCSPQLNLPSTLDIPVSGYLVRKTILVPSSAGGQALSRGSSVHRIDISVPEVPGKVGRLQVRAGFRFMLSQFSVMLQSRDEETACFFTGGAVEVKKGSRDDEERGGEWSNTLAEGVKGEEVMEDLERERERIEHKQQAADHEGRDDDAGNDHGWQLGDKEDSDDFDIDDDKAWDKLFDEIGGHRGPFGKLGGLSKFFDTGGDENDDDLDDDDDDLSGDDDEKVDGKDKGKLLDDDFDSLFGKDDLWDDNKAVDGLDDGGWDDDDDDEDEDEEKGEDYWDPFSAMMKHGLRLPPADHNPPPGTWGMRRLLEAAESVEGRCLVGSDSWNHNTIDTALPPGQFTLWIAKAPFLSGKDDASAQNVTSSLSCVPLDLSLSVTFDDPPPLESTCAARTLPTKLDEPGYLASGGRRMHVQGTYAVGSAKASRRHSTDFRVYESSIIRVHVQSMAAVDIRLLLYKLEGEEKAYPVKTETPALSTGVRGDSLLALIPEGNYQLQVTFANPGGTSGIPLSGQSRSRCLEMDLELAIDSAKALGEAGAQCAPEAADKIPSRDDLGTIRVGTRFNEGLPASLAEAMSSPKQNFYVHVRLDSPRLGGKGLVAAEYAVEVREDAVLQASAWSDFLLDDVSIDVYNKDGSLALVGMHRGSVNSINSLIRKGDYLFKVWLPMSAQVVLQGSAKGTWEKLYNENKQAYYFNKELDKTQWDPPKELSTVWCARFSLSLSLLAVSQRGRCQAEAGAIPLPTTLHIPGKLDEVHKQATLVGTFAVQGARGASRSDPVKEYLRIVVREKSILRAYVSPLGGRSMLTSMSLIGPSSSTGKNASALALLARSQPWSPASYSSSGAPLSGHDVGDDSRQVIKHSLLPGSNYVLRLEHSFAETKGCDVFALQAAVTSMSEVEGTNDGGQAHVCDRGEVWPEIPEDLNGGLSGCAGGADGERCVEDPFNLRFSHESKPKMRRYSVFVNQDTHLRVELGFDPEAPPLAVSVSPTPCDPSRGPCPQPKAASTTSPAAVWSTSQAGGGSAILVAPFLHKGQYMLTIMEMATNTTSRTVKSACVRYSFRLRMYQTSSELSAPSAPPLPSTLDSPAFLEYGGATHFMGTFAMHAYGASSQDIPFTLATSTMIRIDAVPRVGKVSVMIVDALHGQQVASGVETMPEQDTEGRVPSALQRAHLRGTLPSGKYALRLSFSPDVWSVNARSAATERGVVALEVAISPEGYSSPSTSAAQNCQDSTISAISAAAMHHNEYHLAPTPMSVTAESQTKSRTLQSVPVSIAQASRIRAVVNSDFLHTPLFLVLQKGRVSPGGALGVLADELWPCRKLLNGCELDVVVEAGDYALKLWQPIAAGSSDAASSSKPLPSSPSCALFKIAITVVPEGRSVESKCGSGSLLPSVISLAETDSADADGGTPSNRGTLSGHRDVAFWSSAKLMMPIAVQGEAEQKVAIKVPIGDTLVYALVVNKAEESEIKMALAPSGSVQIDNVDRGEPVSNELVDAMRRVTCEQESCTMNLVETFAHAGQHEECPSYSLAVYVRSQTSIDRASVCAPGAGASLPKGGLQVSDHGYALYEFEESLPIDMWPPESESCIDGDCSRSYTHDTPIETASFSLIEASLEFDPLSTSFDLYLLTVSPDGESTSIARRGTFTFPKGGAPLARLHISAQVARGSHALRIERHWQRSQTKICSPIKWKVAVSPIADDAGIAQNLPYVWQMSPAGLTSVPPATDLVVQLVLSEGLRDGFKEDSFLLSTRDESTSSLHASWIESGEDDEGRPLSTVAFKTSGMKAGKSYVLRFAKSSSSAHSSARSPTGSASGLPFRQPPPWSFSVPASLCSSHGAPTPGQHNLCRCDEGFAGWACSACIPGNPSCQKLEAEEAARLKDKDLSSSPEGRTPSADAAPSESGPSIVEEERKGEVVDLDDEEQEKEEEERVQDAYQKDAGRERGEDSHELKDGDEGEDEVEEGRVAVAHPQSQEGDDWIQDNEPGRRVPVDAVTQDGAVDADAMTEEPRPSRTHHSRVDPIRNNDQRIESQDAQAKRPNERASALFRAGGMGWAAAVAVAGICLGSLLGAVALFSWRKRRAGGNQRSFEERYRMRTFADNDL